MSSSIDLLEGLQTRGYTHTVIAFVGVLFRLRIYTRSRRVELNPRLPTDLRTEAKLRRQMSMRRVWLKCFMAVICAIESAVILDRWWFVEYDIRDFAACFTMTLFLLWMLTWRDP